MSINASDGASTRQQVRRAVLCWLVWAAAVWGIALLAGKLLPPEGGRAHPRSPVAVLSAWDGAHYAHIATYGYSPTGIDRLRYAFFPLLPGLGRLLGGRDHAALAGILLAQLCTLATALLLQREERRAGSGGPRDLLSDPAFWLVASPCSFFLGALYPESLFLLLSFLLATATRRGQGSGTAISGFLAGLARPTAVTLPALALPALLSWRRQGELPWAALLAVAAPLAGVGLYLAYTGTALGNAFGYTIIQKIWGHEMAIPFFPFARDVAWLCGFPGLAGGMTGMTAEEMALRIVSTLGVAALATAGWKHLDAADRAYLLVSFVFIHSQGKTGATPRHELALFPFFLLLARTDFGRLRVAMAILFVVCQALLLVRHASWLWVA